MPRAKASLAPANTSSGPVTSRLWTPSKTAIRTSRMAPSWPGPALSARTNFPRFRTGAGPRHGRPPPHPVARSEGGRRFGHQLAQQGAHAALGVGRALTVGAGALAQDALDAVQRLLLARPAQGGPGQTQRP